MTDTARTLAEIKTLLANNSTGAISAQDLRDVVESIAHPLEGEGFLGSSYVRSSGFGVSTAAVTLTAHPTSYGTAVIAPWGANRPNGSEIRRGRDLLSASFSLDGADETNAYGLDIDAGNALMLEPGVWFVDTVISASGMSGLIPAWAYFDQAQYDPDWAGTPDGTESWWYDGWYNPMSVVTAPLPANATSGVYTSVRTLSWVINDSDEPKPFIFVMYTLPGRTTNLTTTGFGFAYYKVS